MKAVIQRVSRASVEVDGRIIGQIGMGLLALVGVAQGDGQPDADYMVEKLATMRVFGDQQGKMNLSIGDVGGSLLLVSQFTLLADTSKGRRPGFDLAAPPETARLLYEQVAVGLKSRGLRVETGIFGAHMKVELLNDGPVTFVLDSRERA
jgi:D-tyrosyl-tRNA(Tyr) deacylase